MPKIAELKRDLESERERVEHKREQRNNRRDATQDKGAKIKQLREIAVETRDDRNDSRKRLVVVRSKLNVIGEDGVDVAEQVEFDRLSLLAEGLVDETEELTALLQDKLYPRIEDLAESRDKAREDRQRFGEEMARSIQRRQRIAKELKQAKANQVSNIGSKYFTLAEFDCREGAPCPTYMIPHLRELTERVLDKMRERFGPGHVNSGHRWRFYNIKIGGALFSFHEYEMRRADPAGDCTFATGTPAEWAAFARSLGVGGVGQYATFCHVDTGPRRDWSG